MNTYNKMIFTYIGLGLKNQTHMSIQDKIPFFFHCRLNLSYLYRYTLLLSLMIEVRVVVTFAGEE